MKKLNSIRFFFVCAVLGCSIAYGVKYTSLTEEWKEPESEVNTTEEEIQEQQPESMESSTTPADYVFVLREEYGYILVYYADEKTVYATTDIELEELSKDLQSEIKNGKKIADEKELYNFLESYSS